MPGGTCAQEHGTETEAMRDTEPASEREPKEKFGFLISQNGGWQGWVLLSINIAEKQTPRKEQPWRFTKWYKPAMSKIKLVPTVIFWEVQSPNSFQLEDWQRNNVHPCKAPLPNRSRSLQSEAASNELRATKDALQTRAPMGQTHNNTN